MDPRIKSGGDEMGEEIRFHLIAKCARSTTKNAEVSNGVPVRVGDDLTRAGP